MSVDMTESTWRTLAEFSAVLNEVEQRGVTTNSTYGSPVYLGQYLNIHTAVDAEMARLRDSGIEDPLVVDWGAGVGHFAFVRKRFGDRVVAHSLRDPNDAPFSTLLEVVCDLEGIEMRATEDPVVLPFGDGEVGVLASCGVLEHVHEGGGSVAASLAEIERVLAPGGAFVCGHLPRYLSWVEALNRCSHRSHHDRRFTAHEVNHLDDNIGLELVGPPRRYGVMPRIQAARGLQRAGRDSVDSAVRFEAIDRAASRMLGRIGQNYLFVMRKPLN